MRQRVIPVTNVQLTRIAGLAGRPTDSGNATIFAEQRVSATYYTMSHNQPSRSWSMTATQTQLYERLKRLGFTREKQIRLYGSQFEVVGDPVVLSDTVVFFDAVEQKSGERRRVRIPLTIVQMAGQHIEVANL